MSTGIEYSNRTFNTQVVEWTFSPSSFGVGPVIYDTKEHMSLVSVPVNLQYDFLNFFFINGGLLFDIDFGDTKLGRQSGVDAQAGAGVRYHFKQSPFTVFAQPYVQAHRLIKFADSQTRFTNTGIRVGINYRL